MGQEELRGEVRARGLSEPIERAFRLEAEKAGRTGEAHLRWLLEARYGSGARVDGRTVSERLKELDVLYMDVDDRVCALEKRLGIAR